jgi:hypothetical protein
VRRVVDRSTSLSALGTLARRENLVREFDVRIPDVTYILPLTAEEGRVLRYLAHDLHVGSLFKLVSHPDVDRRLAVRAAPQAAARLVHKLQAWLLDMPADAYGEESEVDDAGGNGSAAAISAQALLPLVSPQQISIPPPPASRAALQAWADAHGVRERLSCPLTSLPSQLRAQLWMSDRRDSATLEDLATGSLYAAGAH